MKINSLSVAVLLLFMAVPFLSAQDIPTIWGVAWPVAARPSGMGGAFTGVAEGYGAFFYNPAGLALSKNMEVYGSFTRISQDNTSSYLGMEATDNLVTTGLNTLGLTLPLPTSRGSLVLGIGYHKVRNFDRSLFGEIFISTPGDSVTWSYTELENGSLGNTVFAGAVEVAPRTFLGAAINFWTGMDSYTSQFIEKDTPYDLWTFSEYYETLSIDTKFTGVNFVLSGLAELNKNVRIGCVLQSPVTLLSKEDWSYSAKTNWDDGVSTSDSTDAGYFDYRFSSPWKLRVGASLHVGPVLLAGDVEMNDYSRIVFKSDPPSGGSMAETNLDIRRTLRNTLDYAFGGELNVPGTNLVLRGGYGMRKSPYKESGITEDRTFLSAGAGYQLNKNLSLEFAATMMNYNQPTDAVIQKEDVKTTRFILGFIYAM